MHNSGARPTLTQLMFGVEQQLRVHFDLADSDLFVHCSINLTNNGSIFFPLSAALSSHPSEKTLV